RWRAWEHAPPGGEQPSPNAGGGSLKRCDARGGFKAGTHSQQPRTRGLRIAIMNALTIARRRAPSSGAALAMLIGLAGPAPAQVGTPAFTIEQVLTPAFPSALTAAASADRIAWIENQVGRRNVYTAAAPDFERVRITATEADDAIDLGTVQLSADGSIVAFIRGHTPNFKGQIGNQGSHADGGRREVWAAPADGSRPP